MMNKFIKVTTVLLLVLGGLTTTVSAQKLLKLGTDSFTLDSNFSIASIVSYPVVDPLVVTELSYAKKPIQANYVAGTTGVPAKGTWNVIGMN